MSCWMQGLLFCTHSSTSSYPEHLTVSQSYHLWFGPSSTFCGLPHGLLPPGSNRRAVSETEFSSQRPTWLYHQTRDSCILSVICATLHHFLRNRSRGNRVMIEDVKLRWPRDPGATSTSSSPWCGLYPNILFYALYETVFWNPFFVLYIPTIHPNLLLEVDICISLFNS